MWYVYFYCIHFIIQANHGINTLLEATKEDYEWQERFHDQLEKQPLHYLILAYFIVYLLLIRILGKQFVSENKFSINKIL